MELSRKHKLLMLFLSAENPLLSRIVAMRDGKPKAVITSKDVPALTGISRETPKNWRKGKDYRASKVQEAFDAVSVALKAAANDARRGGRFDQEEYDDIAQRLERFKKAVDEEENNLYDAARVLGMTMMTCQRTLDHVIYDAYPLMSSVHYPGRPKSTRTQDLAELHRQRYEGVYVALVRREGRWLQAPLRVRYLLESGQGRFLRCKLNFPLLSPGQYAAPDGDNGKPGYWEYDGYLAVREPNNLFWSFEKRQPERSDFFHFVTSVTPSDPRDFVLTGRYLTTGQDEFQSIQSDVVMLRKLFTDNDPLHLSYREVMWSRARILTDEAEIEEANRTWLAYRRPESPRPVDDFTT